MRQVRVVWHNLLRIHSLCVESIFRNGCYPTAARQGIL